ncbi:MAG: homoserine dehydrogenase [Dehalococcoidales bacterium]|nr:homoserine dehydrogenase [Dehalococcoidales bacterium]
MSSVKKVAVIGFGNIGVGVVRALYEKGVSGLELVRVVDIDLKKRRPVKLPKGFLIDDWKSVVKDPEIDIIIELIGGIEPAKSIITQALKNGKDVVTANKKLLAAEGKDLFALAAKLNRRLGFRASFVGCHSLIHEFQQAGNASKEFRRIYAILNGTSNYILSKMTSDDMTFKEALREAKEHGLAERDPSDDIDGTDTANKIRILLNLITNSYQKVPDFPIEGMRDINTQDIKYAGELGYAIKLVGAIEQVNGSLAVGVHPALLPDDSLLGTLQGAYNGTELEDEYGVISGLVAPGAGVYPTTDAVVKDLVDIVEGRTMPLPTSSEPLVLSSTGAAARRYYLRFSVANQSGVLAQICNIFWKYHINIAGVIQKEPVSTKFVPLVMTTYEAKEKDILAAVQAVDELAVVKVNTKLLRILSADT